MNNDVDYQKVWDFAYMVASNYIYDKDIVKDIAQMTTIDCFLKKEKLELSTLNSWIFVVARNKSYKYIKDYQRKSDLYDNVILNSKLFEDFKSEIEPNEFETLINNTPNLIVSIKDKEILLDVLKTNYDFYQLSKKYKIQYNTLRKKVYRIHQEILLYQKVINNYKRSRPIPGTRIHENILNFLSKLKSYLNNNDLSLFNDFNIEKAKEEKLKSINIKEVADYQITFKDKNLYELFIPYFDIEKKFCCMWIDIKVDRSRIFIASIPTTPSKIRKINRKELPHPLKKTFRDDSEGMPSYNLKELDQKLKECANKVEIIYKDTNEK